MSTRAANSFVFPHPVWRIGFSGHRELADEALLASSFALSIGEAGKKVEGTIECFLSLAKGADILMAEACLQTNVPYHVLLPFEVDQFREAIAAEWRERFDSALDGAISVESLKGSRSREAAFYKCGIDILNASDMMLFCWDGGEERGLGGTAQIVQAAKAKKLPFGWIHAHSGELAWERFETTFTDPTAEEVERFASVSIDADARANAQSAIDEILETVDREASKAAPQHRFLSVSNLSIHAVATIIATIGLGFAFPGWGIAKVILLLIALCVFFFAQRQRLHERWFMLRGLSEVIRSLKSCGAFLPRSAMDQLWESFYQFGQIARPLYNLVHSRLDPEIDWEQNRANYLSQRVDDQIEYYTRRVNALRPTQSWLNRLFWVFLGAAIVAACIYAAEHSFGHGEAHVDHAHTVVTDQLQESDYTKNDWLGKSTIILPILSMLMISIKSALDIDRRLARFSEMKSAFERSRESMSILIVPSSFYEAVVGVERRLLQEVSEWYQNVRHLHIH